MQAAQTDAYNELMSQMSADAVDGLKRAFQIAHEQYLECRLQF